MTQLSHIWRSKDGGSTFEDITERFNSEWRSQLWLLGAVAAPPPRTPPLPCPALPHTHGSALRPCLALPGPAPPCPALCARAASIKGAEPISILSVKTNPLAPGQVLFVGAGTYMWCVGLASRAWGGGGGAHRMSCLAGALGRGQRKGWQWCALPGSRAVDQQGCWQRHAVAQRCRCMRSAAAVMAPHPLSGRTHAHAHVSPQTPPSVRCFPRLTQDYGDTVVPFANPGGFRGIHAHVSALAGGTGTWSWAWCGSSSHPLAPSSRRRAPATPRRYPPPPFCRPGCSVGMACDALICLRVPHRSMPHRS